MLQAGKTAMKKTAQLKAIAVVLSGVVIPVAATGGGTEGIVRVPRPPVISPDYTGVVIPPNMAPLNFTVREAGVGYRVEIAGDAGDPIEIRSSRAGIEIPSRRWRELLSVNKGRQLRVVVYTRNAKGIWRRFNAITNRVAQEAIDSHIVYRLIPPIHRRWHRIGIHQRCIETFSEKTLVDNRTFERGCVNCHTFRQNRPDTMSFQVRSRQFGLPMIVVKDDEIRHVDTRTGNVSPAAYHSWHPSGRLIAFSRNKPSPFEHTANDVRDVWDADSDLAVYFVDANRVEAPAPINQPDWRETWPSWSSDGKHLYFCRSRQVPVTKYREVRYDLVRVAYDAASNTWGDPETLVSGDGVGMSTGQPRESPDGRWLLFCMCEYGNFPVYQRSSDLYLMDLQTRQHRRLEINSDLCDSWHSWSSNGRWVAFSSKRGNGLLTRLHFSYVDNSGRFHKPIVMPQRDPAFYDSFTWTYNVPELVDGPVRQTKAQFGAAICEPRAVLSSSGE